MKNDDRKNVGALLSQTTLLGGSAGLGFGAFKYAVDTTSKNLPKLKATRSGLGIVLVGSNIYIYPTKFD